MNKLIETAKELDRILESGIEILPNSPIHKKLKQALNIACVNARTYPKEYVVLLKPNYVAKDGSMKRAYSTFIDSHETWLAPKDDLYVR